MRTVPFVLVFLLVLATSAGAFQWDQEYDGSVLPSAADPAWIEATTGGGTSVGGGSLRLTDPVSWDINNSSFMMGTNDVQYFNSPDDGVNSFTPVMGYGFTLEWRMKINWCAGTPSDSQLGLKLEFGSYPTNKEARIDWYYDVSSSRLVNNQYKNATVTAWPHEGRTGPEGAETILTEDAFPGIGLGEWHTYRMTTLSFSGVWHRELWLDSNYVGRWWSEKNATGISPVIKMRSNNDMTPNNDVEFDWIRWADEAQGMHFYTTTPVPEPGSLMVLGSALVGMAGAFLRRRS